MLFIFDLIIYYLILVFKGYVLSTKDNIKYIKDELTNEEKMLEQIVRLERFYKKYKKLIISGLIIAILALVSYISYNLKKEYDLKVSNIAYLKLLKNPNDSEALNILKEKNRPLFVAFEFKMAIDKNDEKKLNEIALKNINIISNIAKYQAASLLKDQKRLRDYGYDQKALLKDLAMLEEAFLLYSENKIEEAKSRLKNIPLDSLVYPYAKFLLHYGVKGNAK